MIYSLVFIAFSLLIITSAIAVITVRNPVHSVLFLIFAFFNASGLMILLGAEFIGMVFIIVYVGAIAILFLFVVMTLDLNAIFLKDYVVENKRWFFILGGVFFINIITTIYFSIVTRPFVVKAKHQLTVNSVKTNTHQLGEVLYTEYGYLFQICGLILFAAVIGAIFLVHSLKNSKLPYRQSVSEQCTRNKKNSLKIVYMKTGRGVDDYNRH